MDVISKCNEKEEVDISPEKNEKTTTPTTEKKSKMNQLRGRFEKIFSLKKSNATTTSDNETESADEYAIRKELEKKIFWDIMGKMQRQNPSGLLPGALADPYSALFF